MRSEVVTLIFHSLFQGSDAFGLGAFPAGKRAVSSLVKMSMNDDEAGSSASNVLGTQLCPCCADVGGTGIGTGFYRNGYCLTGEQDLGRHTVCCQVTEEFLDFSKAVGNDLSTPVPQFLFPGLKDGDIWCLCAQRWVEAYENGMAPKVFLQATHEKTLTYVDFETLREHAIDQEEADKALCSLNEQRDRLNKLL
jgi:uncharacterized protein (DUF2237 family)